MYAILQNRLYVGEVSHNGDHYAGQHEALIDSALFERVQQQITERRVERRLGVNAEEPSLLAGLLWDAHGRRMSPRHASKQGRRYRYYLSQTDGDQASAVAAFRISAGDLEGAVGQRLCLALAQAACQRVEVGDLGADEIELLQANVSTACERLNQIAGSDARELILRLVSRIEVAREELQIVADLGGVDLAIAGEVAVSTAVAAVRSGKTTRLVMPPTPSETEQPRNPALIKLVAQAFRARAAMEQGESMEQVAAALDCGKEYLTDLIRTSYLSPTIISAIVDGRQPASLTRKQLMQTNRIPLAWAEQERAFGLAG